MARSHNKKRNVGIIYEQIINYVCNKLMNKEKDKAEVAIKIIKNNFKKDTQLYKEYKLFKALASTHNVSDHLASSIITEPSLPAESTAVATRFPIASSLFAEIVAMCMMSSLERTIPFK